MEILTGEQFVSLPRTYHPEKKAKENKTKQSKRTENKTKQNKKKRKPLACTLEYIQH